MAGESSLSTQLETLSGGAPFTVRKNVGTSSLPPLSGSMRDPFRGRKPGLIPQQAGNEEPAPVSLRPI